MKQIAIFMALILLFSMTFVIAQSDNAQQGQEQAQNQEISEDAIPTLISEQTQTRARNKEELKQMIQERKELQQQELGEMKQQEQKVFQNQNRVRLAVHALLAMENLTGGIGQQVSAIAREFNNSAQATIRQEQRMQMRNALTRFFAGGDEAAAEEMEQEVNQNREKITSLRQLYNECDCDAEVKAMMQEQIQNMEQEQNRLNELAAKEKKSKGLFGWLWK